MNNKEKIFIQKIKKRKSKSLIAIPVFSKSSLSKKVIDYLAKQQYLEFSKMKKLIEKDFNKKFPFGYVLKNQIGEIVGFLGTMFSTRVENNKDYILCNLHTWIVEKSHRLNSYLLLIPLLDMKYTITALTPLKTLAGLLEKFGFKKIKMKYRITFLLNLLGLFKKKRFKIEEDKILIKKYLNQNDWKIYQEHVHLSCLKFIIIDKYDPSNTVFVIALKKKKKYFQALDLFYVSNNKFLKKHWLDLCSQISLKFNVLFCGQNFLNTEEVSIPNDILLSKDFVKEICVKDLPADYKFDTLYSEFFFINY